MALGSFPGISGAGSSIGSGLSKGFKSVGNFLNDAVGLGTGVVTLIDLFKKDKSDGLDALNRYLQDGTLPDKEPKKEKEPERPPKGNKKPAPDPTKPAVKAPAQTIFGLALMPALVLIGVGVLIIVLILRK